MKAAEMEIVIHVSSLISPYYPYQPWITENPLFLFFQLNKKVKTKLQLKLVIICENGALILSYNYHMNVKWNKSKCSFKREV